MMYVKVLFLKNLNFYSKKKMKYMKNAMEFECSVVNVI